MAVDERLQAFCSSTGLEVFHSVTHHHQIWRPDPHDVEIVHQEAREVYEHLIRRIEASIPTDSGRILLLLGKSGAGKTHLMRVFRNATHERGSGYFSYLQMTSSVSNYARYVLRHTVESLDKPYYEPMGTTTGLMRLSNALAEERQAVPDKALRWLREGNLVPKQLSKLIYYIADHLVAIDRFRRIDLDLLRALLYLQRGEPAINAKVFKYLRCEPLTEYDSDMLGGMPSKSAEDDPPFVLHSLAKLIQAVDSGALVVCLDQLEDIQHMEEAEEKFRRAMQTVIALAEIPNVIVVIACLADFYTLLRNHLPQTHIDRIELDPAPVHLIPERSKDEVNEIIARRLFDLYDSIGVQFIEDDPIYPFPAETLEMLANQPTRHVLNWCRQQREDSIATGRPPITEGPVPNGPNGKGDDGVIDLDRLWNDHLAGSHPLPEDEAGLLQLLERSIQRCAHELDTGHPFATTTNPTLLTISVEINNASGEIDHRLFIGLCQKSAKGSALAKQIVQLKKAADERTPVAVRSTDFPSNPKTKIAQQIGEFVSQGGRRVVVADSDWRAMVAMETFLDTHRQHPEFAHWRRAECPLSRLPSLREILDLARLPPVIQPGGQAPTEREPQEPPGPETVHTRHDPLPVPQFDSPTVRLGSTREYTPQRMTLEPTELVRHAAFLGGSGSGKTTLALTLIEQLLWRGIPAILVDRKGDLCSYARPEAWSPGTDSTERAEIRKRLRAKVDVALYTPGVTEGQGRPLSISVAPPGLSQLASGERQQLANYSAMALGDVMAYRSQGQDKTRLAVLGQAIAVLSELQPDKPLTIDPLMDFIDSADPRLVSAIGRLDTKHFAKLVQDLQTLSLMNGHLFRAGEEQLSVEHLFGHDRDAPPRRTRLSIISTAFLGDNANVLFWVAQLLLEIGRYAARHPSSELQGVILFDEADMYLPAQSKPATKEPMESLLKRARSAGIGLMLATQSPGDLDYKSRDQISSWFVGKVKETTALNKLRPMLSEAKTDVTGKLANQQTGEFYAIRTGEVTSLKADMSLIRAEQVPADKILELASPREKIVLAE